MQKIGIVGGAAWPSTVLYYRLLCEGANDHFRALGGEPPLPTPPMTIESIVQSETRKLRAEAGAGEEGWAAFDAVIRDALLRLQAAGCDFGLIANNTMHARLHAVTRGVEMPVLSILDAAARATHASGAARAMVLGTSVTMRAKDYSTALAAKGVAANAQLADDVIDGLQVAIDTVFAGPDAASTGREILFDLCRAHVEDPGDTAVILACTELPLAFPEFAGKGVFECGGYRFVDTVGVHVLAALDRALAE